MVRVVAVYTEDARVGAMSLHAGGDMLIVERGEVGSGALVTGREPGFAGIGSVAPFEAS